MIGERIGPYKVLNKLGEGGMGAVFEAVHEAIGRHVAIKILHPQYASSAEFALRFVNEARAVNLVDHPGLVQISDYGQLSNGAAYIVMEYLKGETLSQKLRRQGGALSIKEAVSLSLLIADALVAAHDKGIVHSGCAQRSLFERADESGSAPKDPVGVRAEKRARWPLDGERRATRFPDARTRTGPALRGAVRSRNIERVLRTVSRGSLAARQRTHERCFRPARVLLWESAHDQRPPSPPPQIRRCRCTDADGPLRRARGSERMRQHASVAVPKDGGLLSRLQRTAGLLRVPSDEERL